MELAKEVKRLLEERSYEWEDISIEAIDLHLLLSTGKESLNLQRQQEDGQENKNREIPRHTVPSPDTSPSTTRTLQGKGSQIQVLKGIYKGKNQRILNAGITVALENTTTTNDDNNNIESHVDITSSKHSEKDNNEEIISDNFGGEDFESFDNVCYEEDIIYHHPSTYTYIYPVMASESCDPVLLNLLLKYLTSTNSLNILSSSFTPTSTKPSKMQCFLAIYESSEINLFALTPGIVLQ